MDIQSSVATRPRLLVVDDEKDIGDFVSIVANELGYETTSITNSVDFAVTYSDSYRVIVLDLSMPDIDGIELIRHLAGMHSKAAIILMSGFDSSVLNSAREIAESRGLRVLGTLEKPISIDSLKGFLSNAGEIACPQSYNTRHTDSFTENELRQAINNNEIIVHYQPKIDIKSGFLVAVEALARWQHPEKGLIYPCDFIKLAEDSGLIKDITTVVLDMSLAQCSEWKARGISVQMAVNLSVKTFTDLQFPDVLHDKLVKCGLDPSQLIIEVTESAIIEDLPQALDILTRIRMKGIHLSIDDFGTGYSSIQMLHRGPFDELKIDRSFTRHIDSNHESRVIVETSIALSKKLGIKCVVEGVESQDIQEIVSNMGCDEAQGNHIGKPMSSFEFLVWLDEWKNMQIESFAA